jgi:hypothetical protein
VRDMILITPSLAIILAFLIPISFYLIIVLIVYSRRCEFKNRFGRIAKILSNPTFINTAEESDSIQEKTAISSSLILFFVGIIVFVIANILATFYLTLIDVIQVITVDNEGVAGSVSFISLEDPFHGTWWGSLPWYGSYPMPLLGNDVPHETWEWILFVGVAWHNFTFLDYRILDISTNLMIMSLFFLLPLLLKPVRKSFIPSILLFGSGTLIAVRGFFGLFIKGISVLYFGVTLDMGHASYGLPDMVAEVFTNVVMSSLLIILVGLLMFSVLGTKFWKSHFKERGLSTKWFALFHISIYLSSLLLMV